MKAFASTDPARIAVVGIGNVLLGDDGFGPTVVAALAAHCTMPRAVELLDAGTPGLDLAGMLTGREAVILVDAVEMDAAPGTLFVVRDSELDALLPHTVRVSPHDPAIAEALAIARLAGDGPHRVVLVGAVPSNVEVGLGLSPAMRAAVADAARAIVEVLAEWGEAVAPRLEANEGDPWWTAGERSDAGFVASAAAAE